MEGGTFYVAFRGAADRPLFRDDADFKRFLHALGIQRQFCEVHVLAYCLTAKQVHLLVETPRANLSRFTAGLLTGYANYLSQRYRRQGPITQGRYKSLVVEPGAFVLKLSRMIHLVPASDKAWEKRPLRERKAQAERYAWSSCAAYVTGRDDADLVDAGRVLRLVRGAAARRGRLYSAYLEEALKTPDRDLAQAMYRAPLGIGSESFVQGLRKSAAKRASRQALQKEASALRAKKRKGQAEILEAAMKYYGMPLKDLLRRRHGSPIKPVLATLLTREAGLSQPEAAKVLGVGSGAAVCVQLKRMQGRLGGVMQKDLDRIGRMLGL